MAPSVGCHAGSGSERHGTDIAAELFHSVVRVEVKLESLFGFHSFPAQIAHLILVIKDN